MEGIFLKNIFFFITCTLGPIYNVQIQVYIFVELIIYAKVLGGTRTVCTCTVCRDNKVVHSIYE